MLASGTTYFITGSGVIGAGANSEFLVNTVSGANLSISAPLVGAGSGSLTKAGNGTMTLSSSSAYTGATNIVGGSLVTGASEVLPDVSAVTVYRGATLTLGGVEPIGSLVGAGNVVINSSQLLIGADGTSPGVFSGNISGTGNLLKTGGGALVLSGSNTFTGQMAVQNGLLVARSNDALGGTGSVFVGGDGATYGGALEIAPSDPSTGVNITRGLSLSGKGPGTANALTPNFYASGLGALMSFGNNLFTGNITTTPTTATYIGLAGGSSTFSGSLYLGAGQTTYFGEGFGNATVTSAIPSSTGSVGVNITGSQMSTLILGNSNNAFSGGVQLVAGNLRVSNGGALGTSTSASAINFGGNYTTEWLELRTDPSDVVSFANKNIAIGNSTSTNNFLLDRAVGGTGLNQTIAMGSFTFGGGGARTLNLYGRDGYGITLGSLNASLGGAGNGNVQLTTQAINGINGLTTLNGNITVGDSTGGRYMVFSTAGDVIFNGSVFGTGIPTVLQKTGQGFLLMTGTGTTVSLRQEINQGILAINQIGNASLGALNGTAGGALNISNSTTVGMLDYFGAAGTGVGEITAKVFNLAGSTASSVVLADQQGTAPSALVLQSNFAATGAGVKNLVLGGISAGTVNTIQGVVQDSSSTTSLAKIGPATWLYSPSATNFVSGTFTLTTSSASGTNTTVIPVTDTSSIRLGQTVSVPGVTGPLFVSQITLNQNFSISGANYIGSTALAAGATLTFGTVSGFSGNVTVSGGTLQFLPTATSGNGSNLIPDSGSLVFGADATTLNGFAGGIFEYQFSGVADLLETAGTLSLSAGLGVVKTSQAAGTLSFGTLGARTAGAVVNFVQSAGSIQFVTPSAGSNGVIGGFAYITNPSTGSIDFAATPIANVALLALGTTAALPTTGGTSTGNYLVSSNTITTAAGSANTIRLTGGTLTLGGSLSINSIAVGTLGGILFDNGAASATIAGYPIIPTVAGQELIFIAGGSSATNALTISAPIGAGASSLTKAGAGLLILSGNNPYTGATTIDEGSVRLSGVTATLGVASALTLRQNTTLDLGGAGIPTALYTGGPFVATVTVGSLIGAGLVTNSGSTPVEFGLGSATGTPLFSGLIQDGAGSVGLIKNLANTQYLTGINTYTGPTVLNGGVLSIAYVNTGAAVGAGTITSMNIGTASPIGAGLAANNAASLVFNGGTLQYTGANTAIFSKTQTPTISTDRLFTLAGNATIDSSGNFGNSALAATANNAALVFNNSTGTVAFAGPNGVAGARTLTLQGNSTGDNEMGIRLIESAGYTLGVTKAAAGLWVLSGTSNAYSGATTISGGVLRANYNGLTTLPITSNLTLSGGVLESSGTFTRSVGTGQGQVQWTNSGGFAAAESKLTVNLSTAPLVWGSTPGFLGSSQNLILNSVTALSPVEFANNIDLGGGNRTVQIEDNNTTTTDYGILSGILSNGSLTVVKGTNTGLLYINGANTYAGSTTLTTGNVAVTSIGSAGALSSNFGTNVGGGSLNLGGATLLYYGPGETVTRNINQTTASFIESNGSGPLNLTSYTGTAGQALTLRGINTDLNQLSANLSGNLPITKDNPGFWALTGNNSSLSGVITLNAGVLGVGAATSLGTGNLVLNNAAVVSSIGNLVLPNTFQVNQGVTGVVTGNYSLQFGGFLEGTGGDTTLNTYLPAGKVLTFGGTISQGNENASRNIKFGGTGTVLMSGTIIDNPGNAAAITRLMVQMGSSVQYGPGVFRIGGTSANTYTGLTYLNTGMLQLEKSGSLNPFGTGQFNFYGTQGFLQSTVPMTGTDKLLNPVLFGNGTTSSVSVIQGGQDIEFSGVVTNSDASNTLYVNNGTTTFSGGSFGLAQNGGTVKTFTVGGIGNTVIAGTLWDGGSGGASLSKVGSGTLTIGGASIVNTFTNALSVTGGMLNATLSGSTANQLGKTVLTLGAGSLLISKSDATGGSQTYTSTALSTISSPVVTLNMTNGSSLTLNTGAINRGTASTVLFDVTGATVNTGAVGNWAVLKNSSGMFFAGTSAAGNLQAAGTTTFASFTTTVTGTENATDGASAGFTGTYTNTSGAASLNTLRFNTTGSGSLNVATGSILNITGTSGVGGGILVTGSVGAGNRSSIAGGALTSSGGELIVFQQNTAGTLSISSRIENSYNYGGAPVAVALTKAGDGTLLLNSSSNTYTGQTYINSGTVLLAGGNAIGDRSQVNLANKLGVKLDLGGINETIGNLSGGGYLGGGTPPAPGTLANSGAATVGGEVAIGTATLTVMLSGNTNYDGAITGSGSLIVQGAFPSTPGNYLGIRTATNTFSGTLKINDATVYVQQGTGLPAGNAVGNFTQVGAIVISNVGGLLIDENGSQWVNKINDTAPITLLNAATNTGTQWLGLTIRTDQVNAPLNALRNELLGAVTLAGGNNVIRVVTDSANANPQLTLASLTRTNNAILTVLANSLDAPLGTQRGDLLVTNVSNLTGANLVGGGAIANGDINLSSNQISILPWAIGQAITGSTAGPVGNTFVTYSTLAGFGNGFRALNLAYEFEQLTASGGTTAFNNVRYSGVTDLSLTGTAHTVNALLLDSATTTTGSLLTISGSGASDSLKIASGALLFTGSSTGIPMTLTGFGQGIATGTNEYVITQNNSAAGGVLISSSFSSSGTLTKSGIGLLKLSAANTTLNQVFVNQGTLGVNGVTAINSAPVTLAGGFLGFTMDGTGGGAVEPLSAGSVAVNILAGVDGGFAVDRLGNGIASAPASMLTYQTAANKIIQFGGSLSGLTDQVLSISNGSGYGLDWTAPLALSTSAAPTFNVLNATASNVTQGFTMSGALTGGQVGGAAFIKVGAGAMVLTNTGNTFGGTGSYIDIRDGVLATGSTLALGSLSNAILLNPASGKTATFRATDNMTLSSTTQSIKFGALSAASLDGRKIEVVEGKTLTINSAFDVSGISWAGLNKGDNGTLVLNAANPNWYGPLRIDGGAVLLTNGGAVGSGTIYVQPSAASVGVALQLSGGITVSNPIVAPGNNNVVYSGINFGGAVQSVSGVNTITGLLTANLDFGIGADAGATLNINGGVTNAGSQVRQFHINANGTVNLNSPFTASSFSPVNQFYQLNKWGTGTLNITTAQIGNPSNALTIYGGTLALIGAGTLAGGNNIAATVNPGATLLVNDSGTLAVANRLGSRPITLAGGSFSYVANGTSASSETLGTLTSNPGAVTVQLTNAGTAAGSLTFSSLASNVVAAQSVLTFRSSGTLGTTQNFLQFNTAPTLTGGIIPRAVVMDQSGVGTTFAGTQVISGGTVAIVAYAYPTVSGGTTVTLGTLLSVSGTAGAVGLNAIDTGSVASYNLKITSVSSDVASTGITGKTINSLLLAGTGAAVGLNFATSGGLALTLTTGNVLVTGGTTASLGNATLASANAAPVLTVGTEAALLVDSGATLNLNAALVYSSNVTKGLGGILNINTEQYFNTNTGNYFTIDGGTVVLNAGTNTLWQGVRGGTDGQYLVVAPSATLDLNGNSQMVGRLQGANSVAYQGTGGVITSASPATLVMVTTNPDNWGGALTGSLSFNKSGSGTPVFYAPNTYTGSTFINYGGLTLKDAGALTATSSIDINYATLTLDNSGLAASSDRVNNLAPITMRGGFITATGRDNTTIVETLGNVNLAQGMNMINSSLNGSGAVRSMELQFGTLSVQNDATLASYGANGAIGSYGRVKFTNGTSLLVNGILPFANMQTDLASYDSQFGLGSLSGTGMRGYDFNSTVAFPTAPTATQNIRLSSNSFTAPTLGVGTYKMNALVFSVSTAGQSLVFGGSSDTLNLTAGAFTVSSASNMARSIGSGVGNGFITAGGTLSSGTVDLYLNANYGPTTFNSAFVDNGYGASTRLVYTANNGPTIVLAGSNGYTGGTVLNSGLGQTQVTLQLAVNGANGSNVVAIPAGDLILNYSTVSTLGPGQIATTVAPVLNGGANLNLNNYDATLAGLTFNNNGNASPTVNLGSGLTFVSGTVTVGSYTANLTSTLGLVAGMPFVNANLPSGTTITRVVDSTTVLLSGSATATATSQTFTPFLGTASTSAQTITVGTAGLAVGMPISATYLPSGTLTFITSLASDGLSVGISQSPTSNITTPTALTTWSTLKLNGDVTATSSNVGSVSTISSTGSVLDLNGANRTFNISAVTVNGNASIANVTPTLNVSAAITDNWVGAGSLSTGTFSATSGGYGIAKTGNGLLQLSSTASTFSGGVSVQAGGLVIGGSSVGNSVGATVTSGPVGTGVLSMGTLATLANTTNLASTGAFALGNAYTLAGTLNFRSMTSLTLNGNGVLNSAGFNTINVETPQGTLVLGGVLSESGDAYSGLGAGLNKTGLGTLSLLNANTFTGGIQLNAGTLLYGGLAGSTVAPVPGFTTTTGDDTTQKSFITLNAGLLQLLNNGISSNSVISYANTQIISGTSAAAISLQIGPYSANTGNTIEVGSLNMVGGQILNVVNSGSYSLRIDNLSASGALASAGTSAVQINPSSGTTVVVYNYTGAKPVNIGLGKLTFPDLVTIGTSTALSSAGTDTTITLGGSSPIVPTVVRSSTAYLANGTLAGGGFAQGGLNATFASTATAVNTISQSASGLGFSGQKVASQISEGGFLNRPATTATNFGYSLSSYAGLLNITTGGIYTFAATADDQVALYIDGNLVLSGNATSGTLTGLSDLPSQTVSLSAGLHTIAYKASNLSSATAAGGQRLLYSGPDTTGASTLAPGSLQAIAASNLYYATGLPTAANGYNLAAQISTNYYLPAGNTDTVDTLGSLFGAVTTGTLTLGDGSTLNVVNGNQSSLGAGWFGAAGSISIGYGVVINTGSQSTSQSASTLMLLGGITALGAGTSALTKRGDGILVLGGTNNPAAGGGFTGALNVSGGVLMLAGSNALSSGTTTIGAAGTLSVAQVTLVAGSSLVTLSGADTVASLGLMVGGSISAGTAGYLPAGLTISSITSATSFLVSGTATAGTLGVINLTAGTVYATLDLNGQTVQSGNVLLNNTGAANFAANSTAALWNSGTATAGYAGTLTIGTYSTIGGLGDLTLSGPLAGTVGSGTLLNKVAPDILTLSGTNTISGSIYVTAGALRLGSANALGTAPMTTIASGAVLDLNGQTMSQPLTLSGSGYGGIGTAIGTVLGLGTASSLGALINTSTNSATLSGALTLAAGASIGSNYVNALSGVTQGGSILVSGTIGGNNALTKVGANTLLVSGSVIGSSGAVVKINQGTIIYLGSGTLGWDTTLNSGVVNGLNYGNILKFDYSSAPAVQRSGGHLVNLNSSEWDLIRNSSTAVSESAYQLVFGSGANLISLLGSGGSLELKGTNSTSYVRNNQATALVRGVSLSGGSVGVTLTAAIGAVGQSGANGSQNRGIVPWLLVDGSAGGSGTSFAVSETGAYLGARSLNFSNEVATVTSVLSANNNNWIFGGTSAVAASVTVGTLTNTVVNSLIFGGSTMTTGGTLTIDLNRVVNVDSGGVLATASGSISGGVNGSGALNAYNSSTNREFIFQTVGGTTTLTINVPLGGALQPTTGAFTKGGEGTLVLNGAYNSFTGTTVLNLGTLQFGANAPSQNPLFFKFATAPALTTTSTTSAPDMLNVNPGATLDLNGKSLATGGLFVTGATSTLPNTGGIVTNTSMTASDLMLVQNAARDFTGQINGNINLYKTSSTSQGLNLRYTNGYTGSTNIMGGVLSLVDQGTIAATSGITVRNSVLQWDDSGIQAMANRLGAAPISLDGGAFSYISRSATDGAISIGTVTLLAGANVIRENVGNAGFGSATLTIPALNRTAGSGATVNFFASAGSPGDNPNFKLTTAPTLSGGIIGGWATAAGIGDGYVTGQTGIQYEFATYDGATGVRMLTTPMFVNSFAGLATSTVGRNLAIVGNTDTVPSGGTTINSLTMTKNTAMAVNFASASDLLTITTGGILGGNVSQGKAIGGTLLTGSLTSGVSELFLHNAQFTLTINSQIVNNPAISGQSLNVVLDNMSNGANGIMALAGGGIAVTGTVSGVLTSGSYTINLANTAAFYGLKAGMSVSGPLIPTGVTVGTVSGSTLTLNAGTGAIAAGTYAIGGSVTQGSNILTVPSTANLAPGMFFAGTTAVTGSISSILSATQVLMTGTASATASVPGLYGYIPLSFLIGPGNTYSGTTFVNGIATTLNAPFNAIPGDLIITSGNNQGTDTLSNVTVTQYRANQIADTSMVKLRGGGQWNLNGFNETINSLVFEAQGGGAGIGPNVTMGSGTLTIASGFINATNLDDPRVIPVLMGNLSLPATGTITVDPVRDTTVLGSNGQIGLALNAALVSSGSITKTGSGVLSLGGVSYLAETFNINAGVVTLGAAANYGLSNFNLPLKKNQTQRSLLRLI